MLPKTQTLIVLSPGFPENEADSTCLPLQQSLLKAIKEQRPHLNLVVIAFQYPYKKRNYLWNGIQVEAFGGKGRGKLFRLYNWAKIWQRLKQINQTDNIAGILSFWMGECAFIGERFAKRHHLKHHCWVLGQDAKPGNSYFKRAKPDGRSLIALSDFISRSLYINYGVMPRHIIPGGIDTRAFSGYDGARSIDILSAGSLIPLKQYHLLIEVVCRLRIYFPQIKVVLCGDGPERPRLETMVKKLKLEKNIKLAGEVPHPEVLRLMQQSKIFLHTSNYEGLSMVCLEALYAGAKVISLVRPMDNDIPNWHVVGNTVQMAEIVNSILRDKTTVYQSVLPYKIEDIAAQILALYLTKPATISLNLPAMALNDSVAV